MYKLENHVLKIFLAHPGGPYYKNKDDGSWTIPKGLVENEENALTTAIREFEEETGIKPEGDFYPLETVKYKNGKLLFGFAFPGNWDEGLEIVSNSFEVEWPPRTGNIQSFPEIDRVAFFDVETAKMKIHPVQVAFIERLLRYLNDHTRK